MSLAAVKNLNFIASQEKGSADKRLSLQESVPSTVKPVKLRPWISLKRNTKPPYSDINKSQETTKFRFSSDSSSSVYFSEDESSIEDESDCNTLGKTFLYLFYIYL